MSEDIEQSDAGVSCVQTDHMDRNGEYLNRGSHARNVKQLPVSELLSK